MNRLLLVAVLTLCTTELVLSATQRPPGMTTQSSLNMMKSKMMNMMNMTRPTMPGGMTMKMRDSTDFMRMLATFQPLGTLPPAFQKIGAKLDMNNLNTFRSALDQTSQAVFDKMRQGDFDVSGVDARDIRRRIDSMKMMGAHVRDMLAAKNYTMSLMELKEVPCDIMSALKPEAQQQISGNLSNADRDRVCSYCLMKRLNGRTLKKLVSNFDCTAAMGRNNTDLTANADSSQMRVMAEAMREKKPDAATWNAGEARLAFRAGPKSADVKKLNRTTIESMLRNGDFTKKLPMFSEEVNKEICNKIKTVVANNDWKNLDGTKVKKLKGVINRCKDALDNMPISALAGAAKDLASQLGQMTKKQRRKLMTKIPDASKLDAASTKDYIGFIARDPSQLRKLSDSNIDAVLGDATAKATVAGMDKKEARSFAKRMKKANSFKDPTSFDTSKVNQIPPNCLAVMGAKFLKQIPCSAVSGALTNMKDAEFQTKSAAKAVFGRCKSELGLSDLTAVDSTKLKSLGQGLKSFDASDFASMPASAIAGAKETFKSMNFGRSTCRSLVKKIKEANGGSVGSCKEMGNMRKCLSRTEFSSCGASDLDMDNDTVTPDTTGMSKAQLQRVCQEYMQAKGGMGGGSTSLSSSSIARLAKVIGPGLRPSDADAISVDSDCAGVAEALCNEEDDVDDKTMQKLGMKAKECVDNLGSSNIDEATAQQFAKCLKHHKTSDTEIENAIPAAQRKATMLVIAASSAKKMARSKIRKLKRIFFKNRPSTTDSTMTEDRSNAATISSDDVADMGIFAHSMQTDDVDKMTPDALKNNLQMLCNANMEHPAKKKMVQRITNLISDIFTNTTNLAQAGGCAGHFTQDDVNKITDTDAESVCTDMISAMDDEEAMRKARKMHGFKDDFTTDEENMMKEGKARLAQRCLSASKATAARRRRRTTTTITCDDIKQLSSSGTSVTPEQISTLTTTEFESCIEYLNTDLTGWASDRRTALATKAKETWGSDVSTWTTEAIRQAGSVVVSALSESEIGTLNLGSTTVISAVGKDNYYTPAQLMALYSRYLASMSKTSSSLTSDDLTSMSHVACGATDSHISSMSNSAYKDAADTIGALDSCESAQLTAYANHAKTAFGSDVTTWDTSTVSTVGSMIGGLGDAISSLSTDQLSSVTAAAIQQIPPTTFAKLTVTQLANLGEAQANSVSTAQQDSLSQEQRTALSSAGAPDKTSGAQRIAQMSSLLMLLALFFTRM